MATFLLAGIIVVGLLAALAGLAAGRAASARVVPAHVGEPLAAETARPYVREPGPMDEAADQPSDDAWTLDPEDPRAL